ncbi:MAG TPA: DUF1697 domain-containing protein [Solirubrobacteraceae bacterium]
MPDHVAFLKGMNLGRRRITNDDLRAAVTALGFEQVDTFRASGNVVFAAGRRSDAALQRLLEEGLREQLGYEVPSFIRSGQELRAIAAAVPFELRGGAGKLQVALLHDAPQAPARRAALALGGAEDRLDFGARELYWLPAGRMSDSTLDWKALERALGPTTVRTIGTIEQILARYFTDS